MQQLHRPRVFPWESASERILKIGVRLTKLWSKVKLLFLRHSVQLSLFIFRLHLALLATNFTSSKIFFLHHITSHSLTALLSLQINIQTFASNPTASSSRLSSSPTTFLGFPVLAKISTIIVNCPKSNLDDPDLISLGLLKFARQSIQSPVISHLRPGHDTALNIAFHLPISYRQIRHLSVANKTLTNTT